MSEAKQFDLSYLEKTFQQFEGRPYPDTPIEYSLKNDHFHLYKSSLVTAFYRRDHHVIKDLSSYYILDLACGTGYTTLALAEANPGAKIIATDISPESLKIAEQRLCYHGFNDLEYHLISLEETPQLGIQFDYINASDILYLLPDITLGLRQMGKLLKPSGIIHSNLHNAYERTPFFRAQALFQQMGLMDENPGEIEIGLVREFFTNLKDNVHLKATTWGNRAASQVTGQEIVMNYLLQNDKGFTLPQLLSFLTEAGLQLVDMVDWWAWDLAELFKDPDNLPAFMAIGLDNLPREDQLCLYELIQPNKRLLDFWCSFPQEQVLPIFENEPSLRVFLHPQLNTVNFREEILSTTYLAPVNLKTYVPFLLNDFWLDRAFLSAIFAPLLEAPRTLTFLAERYQQVRPRHPVTLEPVSLAETADIVYQALLTQEQMGILLLERL
ncbi:class I SAM-dependent methyltransferase [Synechocystis sp. LKSZ1]|uniref:class I SAM-dependent methyltransferase n=1 Tax=Synechocystis sp. LKSZ1 TaxID=3144951 RepID=UPI00336BCA06